jgi:transposase
MQNNFSNFIGIDVAKDKIDIFSSATSRYLTVANDEESLRKAFEKFDATKSYVVLENTGCYENLCLRVLLSLKFTVHRANNNKVKKFIESYGETAKTDKIDTKYLALYGENRHAKLETCDAIDEKHMEIKQLSSYLEHLKRVRAAQKNRLQSPGCEKIKDLIMEEIETLTTRISKIEDMLSKLVHEDQETSGKVNLISEYKGVGKTTAINLMVHLPEIGNSSNRKKLFSLAGLAPRSKDSGKMHGYRTTKIGGRPIVKQIMFMTIMCAIVHNQEIRDYYNKKVAEGKKKMVVIIACMRKILSQLNAIVKRGSMVK